MGRKGNQEHQLEPCSRPHSSDTRKRLMCYRPSPEQFYFRAKKEQKLTISTFATSRIEDDGIYRTQKQMRAVRANCDGGARPFMRLKHQENAISYDHYKIARHKQTFKQQKRKKG